MNMRIGIDGSRAFAEKRTGVEEYSYQVIKNLRGKLSAYEVILFLKKNQKVDFDLPKNWKIVRINLALLWTQIGLSLAVIFQKIDILFVSAHILPIIHPKKSIFVVHGLEYEKVPEAYSAWARFHMRFFTKKSCSWARNIIAVSKNTKKDLMEIYNIPEEKIQVVYEGCDILKNKNEENGDSLKKYNLEEKKYLFFIGRIEERKNISGIISAFEILKEKHQIPHKLVLVGKVGYGAENIFQKVKKSKYEKDIIFTGFIDDDEKMNLLKSADILLFPSFYEGFGLPILEAQNLGVPVVASNVSSIIEVAGESASLVDPTEPSVMAQTIYYLITDKSWREKIVKKGFENVKRFNWEKCADELVEILTK